MNSKTIAKNPPQFSLKKNYDDYKKELEIWSKVTTIEKKEQAGHDHSFKPTRKWRM